MRGGYFYRLLTFTILIGLMACSEIDQYSLSPNQFVYYLSQHPGQLLDVRTSTARRKEHLAGSLHLDISKAEAFKLSINRLNRKQPYYIYCQDGVNSVVALHYMRQSGFTQVYLLRGGLQSLKQEGYSIAGF